MRFLRHLTGHHRTAASNRVLGLLLAFNAGAINAGGLLVVHLYTSHMSGFISMLADNLVLGNMALVLGPLGVLLAFTSGAVTTAVLVHWARHRKLHGSYALPLLLEALLMLVFGLVGAVTLNWRTPFAVPLTVLLLSFIMGLQNATVTKMSSSQIRTTHMTGVVTDLGIALGKMLYWSRSGNPSAALASVNRERLRLFSGLLAMFLVGGVAGAAGFKYVGFVFVLPLALVLLGLSLPPLWADRVRLRHALRKSSPAVSLDVR
ncbi:MAG: DUF1275 domain-containing protein [Burkholderiaceae bacterium]|nr:DUF1275 domain-containing protein [Burkholderiaceae bacterium]